MLERERIIEIVAAASAVLIMLGTMYWIGITYGNGNGGGLAVEGGELLVGAIVGFVVLMTIVGVGLAYVLNDPEDGLETDENETGTDTDTETETESKNAV
ncbi:DUF7472 family protein [Natronoglomus mannanivorans]|uniref:Uncharacterized protein n=1 Tax=Natronoglomus mannanivorans TaxID=2979990 RepID=A0AAP3E3M8_9EURY|nr:hypothetical protein [Halobacteria archaeon AArc-xg1-1]